MENFPDKISPMTLAAAIALGSGGGGQPTGTVYYPAGSIPFLSLPALTLSRVGAVYDITDDFISSSDFTDGGGKSYLAGTDVAIVNTGTAENPVLKYNCLTNAINEIVDQAKIGTSATGSDLTLSTSEGNLNALTVYGKSEVVDGEIVSAGEGWSTVDLGTLNWSYSTEYTSFSARITDMATGTYSIAGNILCSKYQTKSQAVLDTESTGIAVANNANVVIIKDPAYTDATAFKNSLNGVILAYEEATPTNNTIAVKTDDGSGINGTMATFSTGTPLRGIPDTTVRDVMEWDGSAGTVTKNCGKCKGSDLTWFKIGDTDKFYTLSLAPMLPPIKIGGHNAICTDYELTHQGYTDMPDKTFSICMHNFSQSSTVIIRDSSHLNSDAATFALAVADVEFVYPLASSTITPFTLAENDSFSGLKTFSPTTHINNNASTEMTVEAYAGTANGEAVNELKQDVQSEITALKITQSGTLTLTTAGWTNNAQAVTYAHDTAKRNVIDVDPASVEEWASCGVLATAETASGITFTCKTVPENALNFRVTSMGVN